MSKATVKGVEIDNLEFSPDSSGKVTLDLTEVDMSDTGIQNGDLRFFGLDAQYDFNEVKVGKVDISASDYSKYDLKDIILSKIVSHRIVVRSKTNYDVLNEILVKTVPGVSKASQGGEDLVSLLVINVLNNDSDTLESAISDNLVRPALTTTFRIFVFAVLFALVSVLVAFLAKAMNLVNDVPVLGKVNAFLGALLGAVRAAVVILMIGIAVRVIISLTGNNLIFLNTMTIDKTYIFRHIYYIGFLNF
jgi:hypothetical protein